MRTIAFLALALFSVAPVDGGWIFNRGGGGYSGGVTSYTATDGVITNTNCSCDMCQAARRAAAQGLTKVCWGGKCYPIQQILSAHQAPVVQQYVAPARIIPSVVTVKKIEPIVRQVYTEQIVDPVTAFSPMPEDAAELMVAVARVTKTDIVYDLGSGDGRVLQAAAGSCAECVGIEINPATVLLSRKRLLPFRNTRVIQGDVFKEDFSNASVVTIYQYPGMVKDLVPRLRRLRPGTRIVSYLNDIPGMCTERVVLRNHTFFVHTVPSTVLWQDRGITFTF